MKLALRLTVLGLAFALLLFYGVAFPSHLIENFVRPVAIVLWVFWRIVLSIDQRILWSFLIILSVSFAAYRLSRVPAPSAEPYARPESNGVLIRMRFWQTSILLTRDEIERPNVLKNDLEQLLVAAYAVRQPDIPRLEINNALRLRQIPLPEHIYAFLYPAGHARTSRSIWQILRSIREAPERWLRHRTGRDVADYYRSIEDVLTLIETTLEARHDEQGDNPKH
jgi:hypothetical protein